MQRRPLILVSLLIAAFVINLDITIVNVALPTLVRELHASNSQLQWVVDAYSLVFASLLLAAGSLSDRLGRKGFLLAGLAVFGLASVAGGLTSSPGQLIVARCFMGLGAAMIFPATLSLSRTSLPSGARLRSTTGSAVVRSRATPQTSYGGPGTVSSDRASMTALSQPVASAPASSIDWSAVS
jgi:MFS family permease